MPIERTSWPTQQNTIPIVTAMLLFRSGKERNLIQNSAIEKIIAKVYDFEWLITKESALTSFGLKDAVIKNSPK